MNQFLNQKQLVELVSITSKTLGIQYPSIIEKDYYVTYIINSLSNIENEYFRLIFSGGTCLAKAHRIIRRMSEDIDFKVQIKNAGKILNKSRLLKELKSLRSKILSSITLPDLVLGDVLVRNEGQYLRIELTYPALFSGDDTLRPHLLLEFTLSDIRLATENLVINTIIEDVFDMVTIFPSYPIGCISVDETAIEKWVGLTRRIAAIERECHHDDPTLVRHIYDLYAIKSSNKINNVFFNLVNDVVNYDSKQFKKQHPEYSDTPCTEIQKSLEILKNKKLWRERYQRFINTMVYEKAVMYDYDSAMESLESISQQLIKKLH